jgi:glycosyltransferase involved in cell wall biosynthesis
VFNGARYLREAIESVLGQSFDVWELIVVDDGSTDDSATIAWNYAEAHPDRIKLVAHPDAGNHGMAAARNLGISKARGRYIGFLDADDIWQPYKLEEQVAILDAGNAAELVYGRTLIWHSWSPAAKASDFYYSLGIEPNAVYAPPVLFRLLLENKAQTPTTCNALMRAELIRKIGGFDSSFPGMFEDQTFFARALAYAPAYVSDRHWANYRQHDESCSAVSAAAGRDEYTRLAFLVWLSRNMAGAGATWQIRVDVWRALLAAGWSIARHRARNLLRRW